MNADLKCELCAKVFTGEMNLQQHLVSEKHKKRAAIHNARLGRTVFTNAQNSSDVVKHQMSSVSFQNLKLGDQPTNEKSITASHLFVETPDNSACSSAMCQDISPGPFYCLVCKIGCSGPKPFEQHNASKNHIKKMQATQPAFVQEGVISSSDSVLPMLSGHIEQLNELTDSGSLLQRKCIPCGKIFNGPIPLNAHLVSKDHQKRVQGSNNLQILENSVSIPDDDDQDTYLLSNGSSICQNGKDIFSPSALNIKIFDVGEKVTFN